MSRRNPPARWVLPTTVDPTTSTCWRVPVPDDPFHKAAFLGALADLASAHRWADDVGHTAKDVAQVWRDIVDGLARCGPTTILVGGADGDENMIRQNPTNPCLLETSINGTDWCQFADFSLCTPSSDQPGSGSDQPPPGGGEACYFGQFFASGLWLMPSVVSSGDTLDLQNVTGAGSDGAFASIWHCPNGQTFFAGQCVGAGGPVGGDPLAVDHMRLIYKINGVYYDAMAGPFTVPGGVLSEPVEVQVNDATLGDNSGSYQFKLCVTNNGTATFTHTFDFLLNPQGFVNVVNAGWTPTNWGNWVAGQGWVGSASANVQNIHAVYIQRLIVPDVVLTGAKYVYNLVKGTGFLAGLTDGIALNHGGGNVVGASIAADTAPDGTNLQMQVAPGVYTIDQIVAEVVDDYRNAGADGTCSITSCTVTGQGSDPF